MPRPRAAPILLLSLAIVAAGAVYALYAGMLTIPRQWNPWAPLVLADPPDAFTRFKLMRISSDDALCQSVLREAQMKYTRLEDRETGDGCGFHNAVRITATSVRLKSAFSLSCRSAVSLALWERHMMQPAARKHFGTSVAQIEHFGSYACRNVNSGSGESARRSRHATADALDVAGFVLADGKTIRVAQDWIAGASGATTAEDDASRFLREVHAGACGLFSTVLGPEYNDAHRDHFHLDRGMYGICR